MSSKCYNGFKYDNSRVVSEYRGRKSLPRINNGNNKDGKVNDIGKHSITMIQAGVETVPKEIWKYQCDLVRGWGSWDRNE